jgi:hypothetical protein
MKETLYGPSQGQTGIHVMRTSGGNETESLDSTPWVIETFRSNVLRAGSTASVSWQQEPVMLPYAVAVPFTHQPALAYTADP